MCRKLRRCDGCFDIGFSLLLLFCAPTWLAAALLVALSSAGPPIYGQTRCGRGGRRFTWFSLRLVLGTIPAVLSGRGAY